MYWGPPATSKCDKGAVDDGLLHDKMSLMWGSDKDPVNALQQLMDRNEFELEEIKENPTSSWTSCGTRRPRSSRW